MRKLRRASRPIAASIPSVDPIISQLNVTDILSDRFTVSWSVNPDSNGRVQFGTSMPPDQLSTLEANFLPAHVQVIGDIETILPNTHYYCRVLCTDALGHSVIGSIFEVDTAPDPSSIAITWIDLPGSIDITGATDVTQALNAWAIANVPPGTSPTDRVGIRIPDAAILTLSRGFCLGSWAENLDIACPAGRATVRTTVGATSPGSAQYTSLFILGAALNYPNINWSAGRPQNIRFYNLDLVGRSTPTPGQFNSTYENQSAFEVQGADVVEIFDCTSQGLGGDLARIGTASTFITVHDNVCVDQGRQGITLRHAYDCSSYNNDFGKVGYYPYDVETEAAGEQVQRFTAVNDSADSYWISAAGGGFLACGSSTVGLNIDDISIQSFRFRGILRPTMAALRIYCGQNSAFRMNRISIIGCIGVTSETSSACNLNTTGQNGGLMQFKVVDGLTVRDNTNPGSGPFVCALNCTSVDVTNNLRV